MSFRIRGFESYSNAREFSTHIMNLYDTYGFVTIGDIQDLIKTFTKPGELITMVSGYDMLYGWSVAGPKRNELGFPSVRFDAHLNSFIAPAEFYILIDKNPIDLRSTSKTEIDELYSDVVKTLLSWDHKDPKVILNASKKLNKLADIVDPFSSAKSLGDIVKEVAKEKRHERNR